MIRILKVMISIILSLLLTSCSAGYICPLGSQPGRCSSQQDAYRATLTHQADKISIFTSTSNGFGEDDAAEY